MKAIVNGLVYNVEEILLDNGESYYAGGIEIIPDGRHIDWEQRRFDLVMAAMQGLLSNPYWMGLKKDVADKSAKSPREKASFLQKDIAEDAVEFADAVLAEYRKGMKFTRAVGRPAKTEAI